MYIFAEQTKRGSNSLIQYIGWREENTYTKQNINIRVCVCVDLEIYVVIIIILLHIFFFLFLWWISRCIIGELFAYLFELSCKRKWETQKMCGHYLKFIGLDVSVNDDMQKSFIMWVGERKRCLILHLWLFRARKRTHKTTPW